MASKTDDNEQMNVFGDTSGRFKLRYDSNHKYGMTDDEGKRVLASNQFFNRSTLKTNIFEKFNRYGYIDTLNQETVTHEYLFFTKPDLYMFDATIYNSCTLDTLHTDLQSIPFFQDACYRHKRTMLQLQNSVKDSSNVKSPFMYLLSNSVTSKLDLPSVSTDTQESTSNLFSTSIKYRTHSYSSDTSYDFSLSFKDTGTLEVYTLAKIYDEYMKLYRTGEVEARDNDVINHVMPEQFSIYKFLIGNDGETILYYAKLTGVYITDVPRSDFGDPSAPFTFSLGFHAQFVEDNDPNLLNDFNYVSGTSKYMKAITANDPAYYHQVFDADIGAVDNQFVSLPVIVPYEGDPRATRRGITRDYRMKFIDVENI